MSMELLSAYNCMECEFSCSWFFALQEHEISHKLFRCAASLKKYSCDSCSFKTDLKIKTEHSCSQKNISITPLLRCWICDFFTFSCLVLLKHEVQCLGVFKCAECTFVAQNKPKLKRHFRKSHLKMFDCAQCSFKCGQKFILLQHIVDKHTELKISKKFPCDFCSFQTNSKRHLNAHLKFAHPVYSESSDNNCAPHSIPEPEILDIDEIIPPVFFYLADSEISEENVDISITSEKSFEAVSHPFESEFISETFNIGVVNESSKLASSESGVLQNVTAESAVTGNLCSQNITQSSNEHSELDSTPTQNLPKEPPDVLEETLKESTEITTGLLFSELSVNACSDSVLPDVEILTQVLSDSIQKKSSETVNTRKSKIKEAESVKLEISVGSNFSKEIVSEFTLPKKIADFSPKLSDNFSAEPVAVNSQTPTPSVVLDSVQKKCSESNRTKYPRKKITKKIVTAKCEIATQVVSNLAQKGVSGVTSSLRSSSNISPLPVLKGVSRISTDPKKRISSRKKIVKKSDPDFPPDSISTEMVSSESVKSEIPTSALPDSVEIKPLENKSKHDQNSTSDFSKNKKPRQKVKKSPRRLISKKSVAVLKESTNNFKLVSPKTPPPKIESPDTKMFENLMLHSAKTFFCKFCAYTTKHGSCLYRHLKLRHTEIYSVRPRHPKKEWYECDQCSFKSHAQASLKRHVVNKHAKVADIKWFECAHCSYRAKDKNHLKNHLIFKHTDGDKIKWHECGHCAYRTKTRFLLDRHSKIKHASSDSKRWFECAQCEYKSMKKANLQRHMIHKHLTEDEAEWFNCDYCAYQAKERSNLKKHLMVKHGLGDVIWSQCDQCEFRCKNKYDLHRHVVNKHTPEELIKWYECGICEYRSKERSGLAKHVKRRHVS